MKLKELNQKGFTLIELLIAIPLIAIVVAATTVVIIQVVQSMHTSAHMSALRQVETVGYWVSLDGLQAQNIKANNTTATGSEHFPLNLSWVDSEGNSHNVTYTREGPMNDLYQLQRSENGTNTIVGQFLTANTTCGYNSATGNITLTVEARVAGAPLRPQGQEIRTYEIKPRPLT
jgi:prepilin-type N-terminal cleavage/methylation domain-containing protein